MLLKLAMLPMVGTQKREQTGGWGLEGFDRFNQRV